jgi:maltose O-acetyltransferase
MYTTLKSFGACGENVRLRFRSNFIASSEIKLGSNIHVGENAWWRADGGIEIGDNTIISRNSVMFTANHNYEGESIPYDRTFKYGKITIGKNVWIGMNVMINQGVTIHDGAIIAMGSVVSKDVPPLAIVGSHGIRILKYRDKAHYDQCVSEGKLLKIDSKK